MQGKYSWPGILVDLCVVCVRKHFFFCQNMFCYFLQTREHLVDNCVYMCATGMVRFIFCWDHCIVQVMYV